MHEDTLARVDLFSSLDKKELQALARSCQERKYSAGSFVLLLKVVNSQAYGPDVVELVGDVTRAAQTPAPTPAPRTSHRAS